MPMKDDLTHHILIGNSLSANEEAEAKAKTFLYCSACNLNGNPSARSKIEEIITSSNIENYLDFSLNII